MSRRNKLWFRVIIYVVLITMVLSSIILAITSAVTM
ncbi:stressosome-associated protein Prli42 [Paenibacillus sp. MBLB4367]